MKTRRNALCDMEGNRLVLNTQERAEEQAAFQSLRALIFPAAPPTMQAQPWAQRASEAESNLMSSSQRPPADWSLTSEGRGSCPQLAGTWSLGRVPNGPVYLLIVEH